MNVAQYLSRSFPSRRYSSATAPSFSLSSAPSPSSSSFAPAMRNLIPNRMFLPSHFRRSLFPSFRLMASSLPRRCRRAAEYQVSNKSPNTNSNHYLSVICHEQQPIPSAIYPSITLYPWLQATQRAQSNGQKVSRKVPKRETHIIINA